MKKRERRWFRKRKSKKQHNQYLRTLFFNNGLNADQQKQLNEWGKFQDGMREFFYCDENLNIVSRSEPVSGETITFQLTKESHNHS